MENERSTWSRVAGVGLLGMFLAVMLEHGVGQSIGGVSLYGVRNAAQVTAFYSHPALRTVYWLLAALLPFMVLFAVAFRRYLGSFGESIATDILFVMIIIEAPLLLAHVGLDINLVDFSSSGNADVMLAMFGTWDGIYNQGLEILETWWMGAIAWAGWRLGALPRWSAGWAGIVALGLAFNFVARYLRLPESALLPTYGLFALWMLATSILLLRASRKKWSSSGP